MGNVQPFGIRQAGLTYRVRPAAYAVIIDGQGRVACVDETSGLFLPGGGIEPGEDAVRAVHREVAEECARTLEILAPLEPAVQLFSTASGEHFELHASFFLGRFGHELKAPAQPLRWLPAAPESPAFFHECHRWAVRGVVRQRG